MKRKASLLLSFLLLPAQFLPAQSTTGNLEGWILDSQNQPVPAVNVYVTSENLQGSRGAATDIKGYFRVSALPVGIYTVRISHISFKKVILNDIHLYLGHTTSLGEIHLKQGSMETEEVIVSSGGAIIDPRSASNSKSLSAKQFSTVPIERNYFHIAELLPNANISYKGDGGTNFAGSTGSENRYFIDGSEITDPEIGTLDFVLPYNFIRQVEIRTGGYQAEYQSSLGGVINTITYSGGNEFHGSIFGFFTNNNFSGAPRLSSGQFPQGSYADYDIGFGIGGPLVRDKLWYYFAYDPSKKSRDDYVNGLGMQNSYSVYHKFAGKLTWNANENNLFILSVVGNPTKGHAISNVSPALTVLNPEYVNSNVKFDVYNLTLRGINNLSNNLMLESTFSTAIMNYKLEPVSSKGSNVPFVDYVPETASGGLGLSHYNDDEKLLTASLKGTLTLTSHSIKIGVAFSQNSTTTDLNWKAIEHWPGYYDIVNQITIGTVKQNNFTSFIQDSWQISSRFCINAGIRWDPQWLIASDGSIAQKITNQVQPRLGIIFQPGDLGKQKITASYGRFYQPVLTSLSLLYHLKGAVWDGTIYPNDPRYDTSGAIGPYHFASYVTNVPDLKGQYYDEFSLGYERQISKKAKFGIRGIYRRLGQGIEDGIVSEADQQKYGSLQVYGNPGSGVLSNLPEMKRVYTAIELTLEQYSSTGFNFFMSYVLSRNLGNYDGFSETYDVTGGAAIFPNNTNQFGLASRMVNSEGLLPNDRTHVFKFFGSYKFNFGLTTGFVFQWMSGTPLNELGVDATYGASTFLQPRGTAGRTPSIWDLNFRFAYDLSNIIQIGSSSKLILDALHVISQKSALDYDQYHYYDYAQQYVNPNYMTPVQFQPPMSFRLGMEMNF